MRLFERATMVRPDGEEAPDPMRPPARKLSEKMQRDKGTSVYSFIAVSGSGKTSCTFDLAQEHFVIYVRGALDDERYEAKVGKKRISERDVLLKTMVAELFWDLGKLGSSETERVRAWDVVHRRCVVELVARLLTLVRMDMDCKARGVELTGRAFLVHQVTGDQPFTKALVTELKGMTDASLERVAYAARLYLAPLRANGRHLVLVIDEMQAAAQIPKYQLQRRVGEVRTDKSLLDVLGSAAEAHLRTSAGWSIVFLDTGAGAGAGAGASEGASTSLASGVGKTVMEDFGRVRQADVPLVEYEDVVGILSRLNLEAVGLGGLFCDPEVANPPGANELFVELPLRKAALFADRRDLERSGNAVHRLRAFIEDYVVGSRFSILAGVVEQLKNVVVKDDKTNLVDSELLLRAFQLTLAQEKDGLKKLVRLRTGPSPMRGFESDVSVDDLQRAYEGAVLTGGNAAVKQPLTMRSDLLELGVACKSQMEADGRRTKVNCYQSIQERFVVESLRELFNDKEWAEAAKINRCERFVTLLRDVVSRLGPAAAAKGNVVEQLLLERLAGMAGEGVTVGELPFIKPFLGEEERAVWRTVPLGAVRRVAAAGKRSDTVAVLASEEALELVWSPEAAMRPDGVVMLGPATHDKDNAPRRAITLASAVYAGKVTSDKTEDQMRSADLSRSFLSKKGELYPAARSRRERWCAAGLQRTVCVRVLVALPIGDEPPPLETKMFTAGGRRQEMPAEHDVVVQLDRTNVHLLLGAKDVPGNASVYELLAMATGTEVGQWGGGVG